MWNCDICRSTRRTSIPSSWHSLELKAALRKGAARTIDALLKLIGKLVKSFAPEDCANYFRHAGYAT